jgi:parallel beta-helix repeat protein
MKKFFVLLFGLIILILIGGCQNLVNILPFPNRAPVIISEPIITAKEDQLYSYQVEASDPDGDNLNYSLIIKPEGMSINTDTEKNGLITWMPTNNQVGIHQVIVEISDGKYKVQQIFEIEVINVNNPPQILSYFPLNLNIEINEGDSVKFEIQSTDVDLNTTLDYRWFLEGESISNSSGIDIASKSTWKYFSEYGDCGIKTVKVLVSDGEFEDSVQWKITIKDITPSNQPILNNVTSPTNVSLQILTGTKETNTSIWINGIEAVSLNSSANWSYSLPLIEGKNNLSITSRDISGNESTAVIANIILDTVLPEVLTLNLVTSPTNISFQTLSGTKETNTAIWINGAEVISINSDTIWLYSYNLFEGINNISVTSCDAAGNESSAVTTIIILDTINPAAPTLDAVLSPTNVSPQTLSGTKETNISVWINNIEIIPVNPSTTWTYDFYLSEGENNISIACQDSAGNESEEASTKIILDTISPAVPTLNEVITSTNISIQILSGNKEASSSIWLNGTEVISHNLSTDWSYSYNLSEGTNNISVTSCDAAGNESSAVIANIILDTVPPEVLTLNLVTSPTNISFQTLSGTKDANTSIWINGIEAVSLNSSIDWSYSLPLIEGENNLSITSRDISGNESSAVIANIILDTIKPEAPTLNAVISPTNISSQAIVGTKEVDSSILINSIEVIPINSSIVWSYCLDLSEGINSITITSKDNLGNESSVVIEEIEYDLNTYVNAGNTSGIEDGTKTHPFNTIAEGIVKVPPGKSVIVAAGTYNEKLIINKGIVLQGAGKEFTFINGLGYAGNLITIEANNVTISGFTIDGNNSASVGIYFNNYSFISINNNIIQNNTSYGINYSNSSPTIENNNIKNNNYSGIEIATGGAGIIKNNSIVSNQYGIRTCGDSSPKISYNDISNNSNTGIYCRESATPVIYYNTINNNSYCGILIDNVLGNVVNPDIGNEYPSGESSPGRNKITGNTNYGIRNKTNHPIKAEKNWWGDVAGPKWSGNNTTTGDRVYWDNANGTIDFYPWLSAAP